MGLGSVLRRVLASPSAPSSSRRHSHRARPRPRPPPRHHAYPSDTAPQPTPKEQEQERMVIASYRVKVQKIADRISQKWTAFNEKPDEYGVILELRKLRHQLETALESYYGALGSRSAADVTDVLQIMESTDAGLAQLDANLLSEVGRFETAAAVIVERFDTAVDNATKAEVRADADDVLIELELYRQDWSQLMDHHTRSRLDQAYVRLKSIVETSLSSSAKPYSSSANNLPPWLATYPPPVNGKRPYNSTSKNTEGHGQPYGPVGAPPYTYGCNGSYNDTFYRADQHEGFGYPGSHFAGNSGLEGKRLVNGQVPYPSSDHDRHSRQNGRESSSHNGPSGSSVPNGTVSPADDQREGGSSESGDEAPMRMLIARNRTLRDMAQNVMGQIEPAPPYSRPKRSRERSNPKVSASDFIVSTPGSSFDSPSHQNSAAFSSDLNQPNLAQSKHGSFASALYYTRHQRVNAISDAGVLLQRSNVRGDGRCLFRSLVRGRAVARGKSIPSERVERDEADMLRERAVQELIKHRDLLLRFFVIEGDFGQYTKRMSNPRTFGGEPELLMLAKLLHVPIMVYILKNGLYRPIQVYGKQYQGEPLRILYSDGVHYDAILATKR